MPNFGEMPPAEEIQKIEKSRTHVEDGLTQGGAIIF